MKLVKLAAGVLNQTPLDWDGNRANIVACIEQARQEGVNLLCLPELCITGYGCEDAFHSPGIVQTALDQLHVIAAHTEGIAVSLGLPLLVHGSLYNVAALVVDGRIGGFVAKKHLAGDGIHYEPRWFKSWPVAVRSEIEIGEQVYPLGDFYFEVDGVRIGFEICEDAWVGERPGAAMSAAGVDIILNPSASHFAFGKHEVRERFVLEGSRAFQVSYVYANLVGNESGRAIYDGDAMIASRGKMLAYGPRFSYRDHLLTSAVVDVDMTRMERSRISSYEPDPEAANQARVRIDGSLTSAEVTALPIQEVAETVSQTTKEEDFSHAVSLALFDYVRKSHSRGVVISLSGGADSAAVAIISHLMIELAVLELGVEETKRKLHCEAIETEPGDLSKLHQELVTTVYQATRNSSDVTRAAAAAVANYVHSTHLVLDVDGLVEQYVECISNALGRKLTWERDDIALQNIQARTRSPSVWMIANIRGALLLSTSNRSEAAVGYATMDGDTSGGLSPIAGIDKAFLREWLRWLESEGLPSLGPVPALGQINSQQPTAELRPASAAQTDESDLMPYHVLDAIERWAIRDKRLPVEVAQLLENSFPEFDKSTRFMWIKRFFELWCRNQWKRERYAPSFHLDDENLDPKTWCRFPILSGGFRKELLELEQLAARYDDGSAN